MAGQLARAYEGELMGLDPHPRGGKSCDPICPRAMLHADHRADPHAPMPHISRPLPARAVQITLTLPWAQHTHARAHVHNLHHRQHSAAAVASDRRIYHPGYPFIRKRALAGHASPHLDGALAVSLSHSLTRSFTWLSVVVLWSNRILKRRSLRGSRVG